MERNATSSLKDPRANSTGTKSRFVDLSVHELRPHPSYIRHKLSVQPSQLGVLAELSEQAFQIPLIITREHYLIDGYARYELAIRQSRSTLPCLEYDFDENAALKWLIQLHYPLHGLCDFKRIELALDLEPDFEGKARLNRQEGGRFKALSKLTEAERVNSRTEIARIARASVGNIHKVKYILAHACSLLQEAARSGEVSINLADKWSHEPESRQQENLRLVRIERGIRKKARRLVSAEAAITARPNPQRQVITFSDFLILAQRFTAMDSTRINEIGVIQLKIIDSPGHAMFVTEELIRTLTPEPR